MKNLAGMMKQASQMQAKMAEMQAMVEATLVTGEAGAGLVRVTLTGKGDLKLIKIDPKLLDPTEVEMLEDLILAACANAKTKADALLADQMSKLTGGLNLPPGLKLPF